MFRLVAMVRVAVLDKEKCKPKVCGRLCYRFCPVVRNKVEAIRFDDGIPTIVESLCVGCGICVRKCPFGAISIVNLPDELDRECSHRFSANSFKLFRLPIPQPGEVLGLIGKNGIGKSTILRVLSGEIKPNLGNYENPPEWTEIINHYRGSVLQDYFLRLSEGRLRVVHKPQYVDQIPRIVKGKVRDILEKVDERGKLKDLVDSLQLNTILDRSIEVLSGGELQRVAIAASASRNAEVYLFDEPSSYLDVKQRLQSAKAIRSLIEEGKTVVVAEHDLAVLDYLSDKICIIYGSPGVYGIVSNTHGVRVGINIYLQGYIPDENVRFREEAIVFHQKPPQTVALSGEPVKKWETLEKNYGDFSLTVESGFANKGEVIGILGPNGIGKTTFIKLLCGIEEPDKGEVMLEEAEITVSYKPQYISSDYEGTVAELLKDISKDFGSSLYQTEFVRPFRLEGIMDRRLDRLSGGELQKVAIVACLSREAQLYLLDEPSAYLDVEERLTMARIIRRTVESRAATAFVVEHDVVAQDMIADRLMVFTGEPGLKGYGTAPMSLRDGMNRFLREMNVTFRRDPATKRPRVNKENSKLDREQKAIGEYYYTK